MNHMSETVISVDFGKLKKAADVRGLSGNRVARESGLSNGAVHLILNGKVEPSAVNLKKICNVVGVPIEDAFTTRRAA